MKKLYIILLFSIPYFASAQVVLGQIDNFEDFTLRNWVKTNTIPNANIADGGPLGVGDNFLRVTSSGTGNDLKLMTTNMAQWQGNYYNGNGANRIKYVTMDVRNSGTNVIILRMSFRYTSSLTTEIWSAINAVAVIPGEGWKKIGFYIDSSAFTRLQGANPFTTTFNNTVTEARILHSDSPSWEGQAIAATLDIDNIQAQNQQLGIEDFGINNDVSLYPNPATDHFALFSENNQFENFEFKIIDLTGRLVKTGNSKVEENVNVENLPSGSYIIQIKPNFGQPFIQRIVKI